MAIFTGNGIIWDAPKNKHLCKFIDGKYETNDEREINILIDYPNVCNDLIEDIKKSASEPITIDKKPLTIKEIKELLDIADIEYRQKATKAELERLLEEVE